jgi:hypothetical protein
MLKDSDAVSMDTETPELVYEPILLRLNRSSDKQVYDTLISERSVKVSGDGIYSQLKELIKGRHAGSQLQESDYKTLIDALSWMRKNFSRFVLTGTGSK